MADRCDWKVPEAGDSFALTKGNVHVWRASLKIPDLLLRRLHALLSGEERQRAQRFRFAVHRNRYVVARGVLRDILSRYLDCKAGEIEFEYEEHGKPKLSGRINRRDIFFNLSHAENLAVFAVVRSRTVGVDVEYRRRLADAEKIAERFFSPSEVATFRSLPAAEKRRAFFRCWTRKEAFIKAVGEGLSHPLHRFDVSFVAGERPALLRTRPDPAEASKWNLRAFDPGDDYEAALVVAGKDVELTCWQWQQLNGD